MPQPVAPVAKCMYVCDDVIRDPRSGKINLVNLWDAVRVPADSGFPYCLGKLCAFVWWRDGYGKVSSSVRVVQASTELTIRATKECFLDFERRRQTVFARYTIEECVFPDPGYYLVELYCQDRFVDDQLIHVIE